MVVGSADDGTSSSTVGTVSVSASTTGELGGSCAGALAGACDDSGPSACGNVVVVVVVVVVVDVGDVVVVVLVVDLDVVVVAVVEDGVEEDVVVDGAGDVVVVDDGAGDVVVVDGVVDGEAEGVVDGDVASTDGDVVSGDVDSPGDVGDDDGVSELGSVTVTDSPLPGTVSGPGVTVGGRVAAGSWLSTRTLSRSHCCWSSCWTDVSVTSATAVVMVSSFCWAWPQSP
ncbi:hypothetical protein BH10ACT9_BH10ACT9_43280 [soil metagenome]